MVNTVNRLSSTDDLHIQHFACWEIMHTFLWSAAFSQNQHFQNILSGIASCSLKQFGSRPGLLCVVTPDLGPNCLQMLSADDKICHLQIKVKLTLSRIH